MKKSTIWILSILMATAFIGLLWMQIFYMHNMVRMRQGQFSEAVKQSLYGVSLRLSQDEARYFLEENVSEVSTSAIYPQYLGRRITPAGVKYSVTTSSGLEADLTIKGDPSQITRIRTSNPVSKKSYEDVKDELRERYLMQKSIMDEVIVNIISQSNIRSIYERADSATVSKYLRQELDTMGLKIPFEFAVVNRAGTTLYSTAGFSNIPSTDQNEMYVQTLFPNDSRDRLVFLKVYFPTTNDYIFSSVKFMYPTIGFTLILLVVFVVTVALAFRQKKLSEMKNDFINNM
ncbi:MAG: two-component sensor histidine kinase, partial [Muribaculaceae bacterium]|nr:two-component sensor histidine kinase [Muribaculaceae bacterium]